MPVRELIFRLVAWCCVISSQLPATVVAQSASRQPVAQHRYANPLDAKQSGEQSTPLLAGEMLLRTPESIRLLENGRRAIIDFRLNEAERSFTTLANSADGRPAGLFHLSTVSFFRFLMSDSESDLDDFEKRSAELKAELDNHEDSPWRAIFGAEVNLQRAVVRAKTGKYVRAALAARSAYFEFARIVREYPTFYDGQKGYGLLKLGIGSMPATYRRFLSIMGFSGSIEEGLDALQIAGAKGSFSREEATALSALAHVVLLKPADGIRGLKGLNKEYPQSALFEHLYAYVLFENRQMHEAETLFRSVVERRNAPDYFFIDYSQYFLGISLFRLNRFDEAETHLAAYVNSHSGPALGAPAQLFLGMSIELQGRRHEALPYYKRVHAEREFDLDVVSSRRAQLLSTKPLLGILRELQLGTNSYDAGDYQQALQILLPISESESVEHEYRAEAFYRIGRTYHSLAEPSMAIQAYESSIRFKGDALSRWAPWSEYYKGRVLEDQGEIEGARLAYERALSYHEKFDYYQALDNNATIAIKRLQ